LARKDLEKLKREANAKFEEVEKLQSSNIAYSELHLDEQVEQLERQLREVEFSRKDYQTRLENAQVSWEVRLGIHLKDSQERQRESQEHLAKIERLMGDLKAKAKEEGDLLSKKEGLQK